MIYQIDSIPQVLESTEYNFLEIFLKFSDSVIQSVNQKKLICTLELFTFGNYYLYEKYINEYIELHKDASLKLLELSILSFVSLHENSVVPITDLLDSKFGIDIGINKLKSATDNTNIFLEKILISMIDKNLIEVMIDDENDSIIIQRTKIIRDAFNPSTVRLKVLQIEDLADININNAKDQLKQWLEKQVASVKQDLDEYQRGDLKQIHLSRKRKSSDNSK